MKATAESLLAFSSLILLFISSGCAELAGGMALDATVFKDMNQKRAARIGANQQRITQEQLHEAAATGNLKKVSALADRHSDLNSTDPLGQTAMMKAAENGHTEVVRFLVDRKADISAKDNNGRTALSIAQDKMHMDIAATSDAKLTFRTIAGLLYHE